jgi:hypothetical protein
MLLRRDAEFFVREGSDLRAATFRDRAESRKNAMGG